MQIAKETIATTTINRTIAHVVSANSSVALLMVLETQAETICLVRVLLAQQLADQTIAMGTSGDRTSRNDSKSYEPNKTFGDSGNTYNMPNRPFTSTGRNLGNNTPSLGRSHSTTSNVSREGTSVDIVKNENSIRFNFNKV